MEWPHALFAILAAFRLTTLFTSDAFWQPMRVRLPRIPWHCSLCMSVWAGIAATAFLLAAPYLNWPLAISWLYLAYERQRKVDNEELNARVNAMQAELQMTIGAIAKRGSELAAEVQSGLLREQKLQERIAELEKSHATDKTQPEGPHAG